jgi:hypothetical protein
MSTLSVCVVSMCSTKCSCCWRRAARSGGQRWPTCRRKPYASVDHHGPVKRGFQHRPTCGRKPLGHRPPWPHRTRLRREEERGLPCATRVSLAAASCHGSTEAVADGRWKGTPGPLHRFGHRERGREDVNSMTDMVGERYIYIISDKSRGICIDGVQGSYARVDTANLVHQSVSPPLTRYPYMAAPTALFFLGRTPRIRWVVPTHSHPKLPMVIIFTNSEECLILSEMVLLIISRPRIII